TIIVHSKTLNYGCNCGYCGPMQGLGFSAFGKPRSQINHETRYCLMKIEWLMFQGIHISTASNAVDDHGGIILAPEGINGSLCGTRESVEKVLAFIQSDDRLKGLRRIESPVSPEEEAIHQEHHGHSASSPLAAGEDVPFRWDHVRVKLKKEIVTLGMPTVSPMERVGKYISPKEWNSLISDPDTVSS
ncbi:rhodanese-like domain-containing protein 7-like, partial [Trifolium pratense]